MESASGYANPATCAGCHQEIAKTYRQTGMGRSFYRPRPERRVEDWRNKNTVEHAASGRSYTMLERDGKLFTRRHQAGFEGKQTNVLEYEIDFVIGSGNHARTYLHRTAEGKLMELPVSWYAENGGYWAMSPGYDRPKQRDFRRAISDDCMFCHNGYPDLQTVSGGEPVFGNAMQEGIDCQRCHGPGAAHVAAAGSSAAKDKIRASILNPAKLDREKQLEVCMQCHLESTSRQLPSMIRRFDRKPFSYRPGEPLGDYVLHFDHAAGTSRDDKFEVAHSAYRLRKSACFLKSQMTCGTCHNPHDVVKGEAGSAHYTKACRNCHASAHPAGVPTQSTCTGCHMPKRRTDDAVHVVMTDHYIQRKTPARDLLAPLRETDAATERAYRGTVMPYYPNSLAGTPANDLYLAVAQVQHGADLAKGVPALEQALLKTQPKEPEFYLELGKALAKTGRKREAIRWFEDALKRKADFRPALKELGAALVEAGEPGRAAEVLEKAAGAPLDATALTDLGNVYLRMGRLEDAERTLQSALSVDPDEAAAHDLLGLKHVQKGDRARAEASFREAIRFEPDLASAHNNLANLLAGAGDYRQAIFHFEKAIASEPEYAEAHHGFGLVLVLTQSYDRALAELQKAVALAPNLAVAHNDLADLFSGKGRMAEAVKEYRLALQLKPDLAEAHLALAQILAKQGNAAEARAHFEKAAQSVDPEIRAAARRALR